MAHFLSSYTSVRFLWPPILPNLLSLLGFLKSVRMLENSPAVSLLLGYSAPLIIIYIDRHTKEVQSDEVKFFTVTKTGVTPCLRYHNTKFCDYYTWGETVFTSCEEANNARIALLKKED